jgi:hypothetical protein
MNLQRWTAWTPGRETPLEWQEWARQTPSSQEFPDEQASLAPSIREIPPLLRRRAGRMGRALLHVLSRPELPYDGQSIVLCSRFGEFPRSLEIQRDLVREGQVSPQQFSMAVHNANGGLFMMARKGVAPLTALAAGEETALAGLQEAYVQLADGAKSVWLAYADEPLPVEYRGLAASSPWHVSYFAVLLELAPGKDFSLTPEDVRDAACPSASPLDVLRFFLRPEAADLRLSARGGWALRRHCPRITPKV